MEHVYTIRINFRATALKTHVFSSFLPAKLAKKKRKRAISGAVDPRSPRCEAEQA